MAGRKVFGIAGYANSGKTTLIRKLIEAGKERGISVGVIKHHGHGGEPISAASEKDSGKFFAGGADSVIVSGRSHLFVEAAREEWTLDDLLALQEFFKPDVVLVEGFKHAGHPKAVLIRDDGDLHLLAELGNIRAVVSALPVEAGCPVFQRGDTGRFIDWFYNDFINKEQGEK